MNELGRTVARRLHELGEEVVAVDTDRQKLLGLPCNTMMGDIDFPATLEDINIEHAKLAFSALRIEAVNKLFAFRLHQMGVPCAVYGSDRWMVKQLEEVAPQQIVAGKPLSARQIIEALEQAGVVRA